MTEPLLTRKVHDALLAAASAGATTVECSLDLGRTQVTVRVDARGWTFDGRRFPYLERCRDRTIYYWTGSEFEPRRFAPCTDTQAASPIAYRPGTT